MYCAEPLNQVKEIFHDYITLADATKLAARFWLPVDADKKPVPAILEYLPYRKNDLTAERDFGMQYYLAQRGYAVIRVDLRGAGDSDGLMLDEYLPQELQDGCDVIDWISKQAWCTGKVGMIGISWGGFNSLQVAALQPPALKAIVTLCSTADRYADDIHYMGGCMLIDQLSWASNMFGRNTLPPDPNNVGKIWKELWLERLKKSGLWLKNWLQHQTRDEFWKHGSICENYEDIKIPVFAASGWTDGYCRTVFHLAENLKVPFHGVVGPWSHKYPHIGKPGPAIAFLSEELRWWDYWLKDIDNGVNKLPKLRLYIQESVKPKSYYEHREGRWIDFQAQDIQHKRYYLMAGNRLVENSPQQDALITIFPNLNVGINGGKWCSYAQAGDLPVDQRIDDAHSVCFDSSPLKNDLSIVGEAKLSLKVSADKPIAQIAIRLVDVAPNGDATRITYGVFNLNHRESHEFPEILENDTFYNVNIPLKHIAYKIKKGHKMRIAISNSYFPIIWPSPENVTLTVDLNATSLLLAVLSEHADTKAEKFEYEAAENIRKLDKTTTQPAQIYWKVSLDHANDAMEVNIGDGYGGFHIAHNDLDLYNQGYEQYQMHSNSADTAVANIIWHHKLSRDKWKIKTKTETNFSCDKDNFYIKASLYAWQNDELVYSQEWDEVIKRNFM